MQYRIVAYKGKVNSIVELKDDVVLAGSIQVGEDLFIIGLEPIEERELPTEKIEEPPGGD